MAKAAINAGICGFKTTIEAEMDSDMCTVTIESECTAIQALAAQMPQLDPFREFTFRGDGPETYELAAKYCKHAACPVPVAIVKAIEVAAGLALPADVSITLSK